MQALAVSATLLGPLFTPVVAQPGTGRPANADKVDAIAQKFKGTHDIAGAAEALNAAVGSTMVYQESSNTGMAMVQSVTALYDQREIICYEFVHLAAYLAGEQRTTRGGQSPRLGPSATAVYKSMQATVWDGASDIPRNKMIVFVGRTENNDSGYFHVGISLGGGKMIHFPSVGGVQISDITKYYDPAVFSEARIADYSWMSAQGDSYEPAAARDTSHTEVSLSDLRRPDDDNLDTWVYSSPAPPPAAPQAARTASAVLTSTDPTGAGAFTISLGTGGNFVLESSFSSTGAAMTVLMDRLFSEPILKADPLPASQGISILQYGNTQTNVVSVPRRFEHTAMSYLRSLLIRPQVSISSGHAFSRIPDQAVASRPTRPDVRVFFQSTGRSSGAAMSMTVVNLGAGPVNIVGNAFALEPIKMSSQDLRRELQRYPAARQVTTTLNGYCFDFAKAPPMVGQVYRLASERAQADLEPLRYLAAAARRLGARGSLHADVNPGEYEQQLLQWAVWTAREHFNKAAYVRAFVEHGKKNLKGAGRKWTKEIEAALHARATNRWPDIVQVLRLAAEIAR